MKLRFGTVAAALPIGLAIGAAAYGFHLVSDYDVWFHLTVGSFVLDTGHLPPLGDPFSWTHLGEPWLRHSWLAQVIMAGLHRLAGLAGLSVLSAALLAGATWFAWTIGRRRNVNRWLLAAVLALGTYAASPSFTPRPQLFAYLLAPLLIATLDLGRRGKRWPLVAIPILLAAWANLHGSVILGVCLAIATVLGDRVAMHLKQRGERWLASTTETHQTWLYLAVSVALGTVATGLNPLGWKVLSGPWLLHLGQVRNLITEWLPAASGLGVVPVVAFFGLLLASCLALLAATLRRGGTLNLGDALVVVATGVLALQFRRQIPFFCLAGLPLAASLITLPTAASTGTRRWLGWLGAGAASVTVAATIAFSLSYVTWPPATRASLLPERATQLLLEKPLPGRLVNSYDWGFYIIYRLWPRYLVSVDGRSDLHGLTLAETLRMERAEGDWRSTFSGLNPDVVLLTSRQPGDGLARALASSSDWSFLYWDEAQSLLVRNGSAAAEASGQIFQAINPFVADGTRAGRHLEAEGEYRALLERWPNSAGAWAALGNLYFHGLGDVRSAEPCFRRAIELNPQLGFAYFGLGLTLAATNRGREAIGTFVEARRLAPDLIESEKNIGVIYRDLLASPRLAAQHFRRYLRLLERTGRRDSERPAIELYLQLTER